MQKKAREKTLWRQRKRTINKPPRLLEWYLDIQRLSGCPVSCSLQYCAIGLGVLCSHCKLLLLLVRSRGHCHGAITSCSVIVAVVVAAAVRAVGLNKYRHRCPRYQVPDGTLTPSSINRRYSSTTILPRRVKCRRIASHRIAGTAAARPSSLLRCLGDREGALSDMFGRATPSLSKNIVQLQQSTWYSSSACAMVHEEPVEC